MYNSKPPFPNQDFIPDLRKTAFETVIIEAFRARWLSNKNSSQKLSNVQYITHTQAQIWLSLYRRRQKENVYLTL